MSRVFTKPWGSKLSLGNRFFCNLGLCYLIGLFNLTWWLQFLFFSSLYVSLFFHFYFPLEGRTEVSSPSSIIHLVACWMISCPYSRREKCFHTVETAHPTRENVFQMRQRFPPQWIQTLINARVLEVDGVVSLCERKLTEWQLVPVLLIPPTPTLAFFIFIMWWIDGHCLPWKKNTESKTSMTVSSAKQQRRKYCPMNHRHCSSIVLSTFTKPLGHWCGSLSMLAWINTEPISFHDKAKRWYQHQAIFEHVTREFADSSNAVPCSQRSIFACIATANWLPAPNENEMVTVDGTHGTIIREGKYLCQRFFFTLSFGLGRKETCTTATLASEEAIATDTETVDDVPVTQSSASILESSDPAKVTPRDIRSLPLNE